MSRRPNAADPDHVAESKEREKNADALEAIAWREMGSSQGGRLILGWLLEPLNRLSYTQHANDTAFREGERSVAKMVELKIRKHAPEVLVLLLAAEVEQLKREQVKAAAPAKADA